jgi:hypothetical protein
MAITLANAITRVRDNITEATAAFWEDSMIEEWIKEGARIFSTVTLLVEDTEDLTLVQSQLKYTISDHSWIGDCIEIYAGIYDNGSNVYKGLIKAHPRMLGHLDEFDPGPPKYITMHNRQIYIWPLPDSVVSSNTVSVLYSKESEDITEINDEYQSFIIIYATAKAKERDRKFSEAASLMSQFYTMLNFERQDKHAREVDSLDKFMIPAGGQGPEATRG